MTYIEVNFSCSRPSEIIYDVLAASLSEIGYESFVQTGNGLSAYIPAPEFSTRKTDDLIADFPLDTDIRYSFKEMEDKNWNEEWEKNFFQPIVIGNRCVIRSSFHKPEGDFEFDILIDPKMAFGTGHHQTTRLVLEQMLEMDLKGKSVLDMGCGTAVLAILASMKGASEITAIDIDEWAYENAMENAELNRTKNIKVLLGGSELLGESKFDVIIANINRNILLRDMSDYSGVLKTGGTLVLSGFYVEDMPILTESCKENGLTLSHFSQMDHWSAMFCRK